MSCLVVEDDGILREAIVQCAAKYIDCVDEAPTGEEALHKMEHTRPDILLTDWDLGPGLDGVQLASHVLKVHPTVKIIFITGKSEKSLRKAASAIDTYQLLPKPFNLEELRTSLTRLFKDIKS